MPDFAAPFAGNQAARTLSHPELVRSIRFMIASEYEAIQLYTQLAESTDHPLARTVLRDIADEERVHAGEFLRLLEVLDPAEAKYYDRGFREVDEIIADEEEHQHR